MYFFIDVHVLRVVKGDLLNVAFFNYQVFS